MKISVKSFSLSSSARSRQEVAKMRLLASSYLSIRLSSCNNSRTAERIFMKFDTWEVLLKFVDKFQFWLKADNNNGHRI
jgi:hypothetical protein